MPLRGSNRRRAMREFNSGSLKRFLTILAVVLIVKVTIGVISNYQNYFPPDFATDFLRNREQVLLWRLSMGVLHAHCVWSVLALVGVDPGQ